MGRALFFGIPAQGHTNPTLPLVRELVARGEEVFYYSSPQYRAAIEATGASFREYRNSGSFDTGRPGRSIGYLYYALSRVALAITQELAAEARKLAPDYVVHDSICLFGKNVARICGIPAVSSVSTFAFSRSAIGPASAMAAIARLGPGGLWQVLKARRLQERIAEKFGIPPADLLSAMMSEQPLNIVYTSAAFQPHSERYDPARYLFVGPSIPGERPDPDTTDYSALKKPLVYVSLGTIWRSDELVETILDALADRDYRIVVAGYSGQRYAGNGNIAAREHVNQLEVLRHCGAFVTHGGMNSVSEALYREVPLVVHPFQIEQQAVADRVEELGCGIRLRRVDGAGVAAAVERVLRDGRYKKGCRGIAASFKSAGGYRRAADAIIEYGSRGGGATPG